MTSPFVWGTPATAFNLMTTELESQAAGALFVSSVLHGTGIVSMSDTLSYELANIFFMVGNPGYSSAFTQGAALSGWWLESPDGGTTFPIATFAPTRAPDFSFAMPLSTVAASTLFPPCIKVSLPSGPFKVLVQNNLLVTSASGATTAPYLKCVPYTENY